MKKVLVIDDDPGILEAMQMILDLEGYNVTTSAQWEDAIRLAEEERPQLIILDVLLSGKDGRDIARSLKANTKTNHIPILMISAHPGVEKSIKECGANAFVAKPFEIEQLTKKINSLLAKSSQPKNAV